VRAAEPSALRLQFLLPDCDDAVVWRPSCYCNENTDSGTLHSLTLNLFFFCIFFVLFCFFFFVFFFCVFFFLFYFFCFIFFLFFL
jgi:hypothetical protein